MGYYTMHNLTVKTGEHTIAQIAKAIYENENIDYAFIPEDNLLEKAYPGSFSLEGADPVEWYHEPIDMQKLSERFPTAIFTVHGEGEEQCDIWEHEYRAGKMRSRKVVISWGDWSNWTSPATGSMG